MICATLKEAKAKLNGLVERACRGEDVILMRGSKHVAAIVPITEDDLEIRATLTDAKAVSLWERIAREKASGKTRTFGNVSSAVKGLAG
jgi:prevent-host-death family protein